MPAAGVGARGVDSAGCLLLNEYSLNILRGTTMARTVAQNQQRRDDRREQILTTAARCFATRGLAATKVADLAAAAGMSQGLLYHYFPSKEDIYVEIIRRAFERINRGVHELERLPLTPRGKVERAITELLHSLDRSEDFSWSSTLISQASVSEAVPDEAKDIIRRERQVPYDVLARIIRAGQKTGGFRRHRADELALAFWTMVKGLALHKAALGRVYKSPNPTILMSIFFAEAPL